MKGNRLRALVLAGGDRPDPATLPDTEGAVVVAADSGIHHALALHLSVDVVVGDLDSASSDVIAASALAGVEVEKHPVSKDQTDLELALLHALSRGVTEVIVTGIGGGARLDHLVANLLVLGSPQFVHLDIEARVGEAILRVVRDRSVFTGMPGSLLTLLALGGPAFGVVTCGLRYSLQGETLDTGSTRGMSNELLGEEASVTVESGVLLAIQPYGGRIGEV